MLNKLFSCIQSQQQDKQNPNRSNFETYIGACIQRFVKQTPSLSTVNDFLLQTHVGDESVFSSTLREDISDKFPLLFSIWLFNCLSVVNRLSR